MKLLLAALVALAPVPAAAETLSPDDISSGKAVDSAELTVTTFIRDYQPSQFMQAALMAKGIVLMSLEANETCKQGRPYWCDLADRLLATNEKLVALVEAEKAKGNH